MGDGGEGGLVGEIIAEIDDQSAAECWLREKITHGAAFALIRARNDFKVATVFENVQAGKEWPKEDAKGAAKTAAQCVSSVGKMDGETMALVFDPDVGKRRKKISERVVGTAQGGSRLNGELHFTIMFPAIEAHISDAANPDEPLEFSAAATADDDERETRVRGEAP
jgi:hypothetical protein